MKSNNGELKFSQDGPVQLILNDFLIGPKPQLIPIRYMTLHKDYREPNKAPSNVKYEHTETNPIFDPERVDGELSKFQITLETYMTMVQECRLEKIAHHVRSDPTHQNLSTIEINRLVPEKYVSDFSNVLQKQSTIPQALDENNPNLKVEINHLDDKAQKHFLEIKNKCPSLYSNHL